MEKRIITLLVAIGVIAAVASQSIYTVHETERAIVLQLGEPTRDLVMPGLHFKIPFIQNVIYLDSRILTYDASPAEALTKDKKTIVLDNYARWRIKDPLKFYKTLRTVRMAQARLVDIVYSELRVVVGRYDMMQVVSSERTQIMQEVIKQANKVSNDYGVEIIDVRIKRTDLPKENQQAIFERMRAERERQARQYRSEGEQRAREITAEADYERAELLAKARRTAEEVRGEGDAEAARIFAESLSQSPDFYEFTRSLTAYKKALKENSKLVLQMGDGFLKDFK